MASSSVFSTFSSARIARSWPKSLPDEESLATLTTVDTFPTILRRFLIDPLVFSYVTKIRLYSES